MTGKRMMHPRVQLMLLLAFFFALTGRASAFDHFITVHDGMLRDGNQPYRFVSFNVPNLNYVEDDMRFRQTNPYRLPDEFEIRDLFATVREMGGQVVRNYTFPVLNKNFPAEAPTYVEAPGKFNEDAFRRMDLVLALANEYGVRVILPLVNNWQWLGGRPNYADFRGMPKDAFWTDPQLIEDFETTIRFVLERKNTITGVKYKDDKAILCWETGNELTAPQEWTVTMTRFIKSIDRNHLVMDGRHFENIEAPLVPEASLKEWSIDIVTTHHYEHDAISVPGDIQRNINLIRHRKAYIVGEFGFAPTAAIESALNKVIAAKNDISGALIWSLRFHDRDGGFYWHSEPLGAGLYKALHWPGFASGEAYDEAGQMALYRRAAFAIRGLAPPPLSVPQAPVLLPIESASAVSWQGAMGATGYNIERATSLEGPWERVGYNISDADVPYFPLFNDTSARIGGRYYYRVLAMNSAGISPASNVVGPVDVAVKVKIDTMKNLGQTETSKLVTAVTGSDRSFKEVRNRLAGERGAELIYKVPGRLKSFDLYAFEQGNSTVLQILGSADGKTWTDLNVTPQTFASGESNYDYWRLRIYHFGATKSPKFIKVFFRNGAAQLAHMELAYADK